jgi:tetratricopeptide (TPR) repeat protein
MAEILSNLTTKEMVFIHPASTFEDTREFYFIHALLRDVTYDNVLKRLRKIYHGYAAAWLETITENSRRSAEYAALIAEHYDRANNQEKARVWYQRAGEQAAETNANTEAIRCLTRCLELWPEEDLAGKFDVTVRRARLFDMLANRQAQKQDLETLQILAEMLEKQKKTADQPKASRRAQVFLQWWHFYDSMAEMSASTAAVQQAIDLAQAYGDQESEAAGYLYLGASLWRRFDFEAAKEKLTKALDLARATQSRTLEGDCLRNLGIVLQYQGNFLESRTYYEQAMHIYHETGSERGESMALNSLGSLITEQGFYREALPYYERALELKRKIGHRRAEHITLLNLGFLADKLGNYDDALRYLEQVLRFTAETGDREVEADALNGLGSVALHMGDLPKAKTWLERALDLAHEVGEKSIQCSALQSMALLSHYVSNDQAAYQYSQDALTLAQELNQPDQQANSLLYAAHALLNLDKVEEAGKNYSEALELAKQSKDNHQVIEIQAGLAMTYLAQNHPTQALEAVEEILDQVAVEDLVSPEGALRIRYTRLEGLNEPFRVLLTCYRVLQALNDRRAELILGAAYQLLREQTDRLPAGPAQTNYLEAIPVHRELRRIYEQLNASSDDGSLYH